MIRRPLPALRGTLAAFCLLTTAGFVSLFVLASQTAQTFAWTIQPPVTAAFLGSGYGAGLVLSLLALRAGAWADIRVAYLTVLVFTWVTALATALHVDRMHFAAPGEGPLAEPAGWFWAAVYVVVPVAMLVLVRPQQRAPGDDPPVRVPMPAALKVVLAVQGAVLGVVAVVLFLDPSAAETVWPWPLTPLTARVVAAWLLSFAVAAALCQRVPDLVRLRIPAVAYAVFGALQLVTVVRFSDDVQWQRGAAWAYLAAAVVLTGTGVGGWWASRRPRHRVTAS